VVSRIGLLGRKREEVTGKRRKLRNKEEEILLGKTNYEERER
jgi:hypothetical protein